MFGVIPTIVSAVIGAAPPQVEPAHARNPVLVEVLTRGLESEGQAVTLPPPRLVDGQDGETQRAALREVAGSDRALEDLLRDSVTAHHIIKVRDRKIPGATIRVVDLWFVVYADIAQVDPAQEAARSDGKEVESGNMWFQSRLRKADELAAAGIKPPANTPGQEAWYARIHGRLLDRIEFEVTNQVVATRSEESIVIASRTDPAFANEGPDANRWRPLASQGTAKAEASPRPYAGGISYTKISRIAFKPGALFVEIHAAFVEPDQWFQGQPILRSKFSVIAQDQIRSLRRELARKRGK